MIKLLAKNRDKKIKEAGIIPAVVYGHKIDNVLLSVDEKEFLKVLDEAGESSLIEVSVEGEKGKRLVLVKDLQRDSVGGNIIHIDFFETSAKEEVEVDVELVFEGESLAVKDLGGTLVKNIQELSIKAMPADLPHEIKVSIDKLKTFEDHILVKDLLIPSGVKVLAKEDEIVASVVPPEDVEAELAKEIEEKVEDVAKVEKEKKEEVVDEVVEK